jgi:D-alanine-D-alanine ligase-like ATP-grasp enzyme
MDSSGKRAGIITSDEDRPTRVCVLRSSYESSKSEFKDYDDYEITPAHYMQECSRFSFKSVSLKKSSAFSEIRALVKSSMYDVFFNLCDGSRDEDRAGAEVVQALEHFGAAFTGSDSKHYEQSKLEMKMLAFYAGIAVPAFAHITSKEQIVTSCAKLKFPVIVKHVAGYNSIGMTKASKCDRMEDLVEVASNFMDRFYEALVEEFIEGMEVSVLACENPKTSTSQTFCPIQILFPPGETFKHFDLKWKHHEDMPCSFVQDPDLDSKCRHIGQLAFEKILGGVGYGRSDLRINAGGNIYLLEINANCGVFYPPHAMGTADFILANDPITAGGFAALMIDAALARCQEALSQKPPVQISFAPGE